MALKMKQIDTTKNAEAQWVKFDDETEILLMPLNNQLYQVSLERMRRQTERSDAAFPDGAIGALPGEKLHIEKISALLAQFIVKDWKGAQDENGKAIGYSDATGAAMLDSNPEFFNFVVLNATRIAQENGAEADEIKGKQSPGSNGNSSGGKRQKSES